MKINKQYLMNIFGAQYYSMSNATELAYNYEYLLAEKNNILERLKNKSLKKLSEIILEDWELDILLLQETPNFYDGSKNLQNYKAYYNLEELFLVKVLKRTAVSPEKLTQQEIEKLYNFIRSQRKVENIITKSGNGLVLDKETLDKLINLIEKRVLTAGHNIHIYEQICNRLGLIKQKDTHCLGLKVS